MAYIYIYIYYIVINFNHEIYGSRLSRPKMFQFIFILKCWYVPNTIRILKITLGLKFKQECFEE